MQTLKSHVRACFGSLFQGFFSMTKYNTIVSIVYMFLLAS